MQLFVRMLRILLFLNCCYYVGFCYRADILEGIVMHERNTVPKLNRSSRDPENLEPLPKECEEYWVCFTYRMLSNISDIMKTDTYNLTSTMSFNRIRSKKIGNEVISVYEEQRKLLRGAENGYGQLSAALINSASKIFRTHLLTWTILPGVSFKVFRSLEGDGAWDAAVEIEEYKQGSRTFGARRRIMMALLPMMYKMGVMTTMLGGLIILALKGLTIGVILLILGFGNFLHKFKSQAAPWYPYHPTDIHVHVHTDGHKQAYSGWHYGPLATDHSDVYEQ